MKLIFSILLLASLALNIVLFLQLQQGSVVSVVYDGDSFELRDGRRVRLLGVDAPEKGRCGYDEAKVALTDSILGKNIRLKNTIVDDYGRLVSMVIVEDIGSWTKYILGRLGRVFLVIPGLTRNLYSSNTGSQLGGWDDIDTMINRRMVALGLAKNLSVASPYTQGIDEAANDAKNKGLGIYSTQCRSAVPKSNCTIKGNLQPEGKVYFLPVCPYYSQVVVDEAFGDVWLCSESQARSMSFTLSKTCQ